MNDLLCRICTGFIWNKEKRRDFRKKHMNLERKLFENEVILFCSGNAVSGNSATCDFFHNYTDVGKFRNELWFFRGLDICNSGGIIELYLALKKSTLSLEKIKQFQYLCEWAYINRKEYRILGSEYLILVEKYINNVSYLLSLYNNEKLRENSVDIKNLMIDYEKDFIVFSKDFLKNVLMLFDKDKKIKIFRQAFAACLELDWQLKFFPENIKVIRTYRDPRDQWTDMKNHKEWEYWIPKNVEQFIAQTKERLQIFKYQAPNIMTIRFEDLCLKPQTRKELLEFVGLQENSPIAKNQLFDWQKSAMNIGIYKNFARQDDIRKIEEAFPELLYKGEQR